MLGLQRVMRLIVSTHSRLKAAGTAWAALQVFYQVSTHSRLKAAGPNSGLSRRALFVSTHSRLKAAGGSPLRDWSASLCFNTQPPEGGWG